MNIEQNEYYKFLFHKAIEDENIDLLQTIPKKYYSKISTKIESVEDYVKENNLFNIKYCRLFSKDKHISNSVLKFASNYGQLDIIKYALKNGANVEIANNYSLSHATYHGYFDVVKYLIEQGASATSNMYPLVNASEKGHLDIVKYLIKKESPVVNEALIRACINGHFEIIKYLVEHGVDIHAGNDLALSYATDYGDTNIINYLKSFN